MVTTPPVGVQPVAKSAPPPQNEAIPTNWNVALPEAAVSTQSAAPVVAPWPSAQRAPAPEHLEPAAPVPHQGPAPADDGLLAAFLEGAGICALAGRINDPNATMHSIGEIFRIVVEGVIATLEARRTVKRELGVAATEFRPVENNPLKFTLGVDDTMETLLSGDERGYLPATQAFQDAFADITRHQMAVLAGMQEAWTDLLRQFDPSAIKSRVGNDGGVGALLALRKSRYWDAFVQLHAAIAADADNEYRSLFYRVFGEAYDRYLGARRPAGR
jgi:type VI secretion system FHA domain protein